MKPPLHRNSLPKVGTRKSPPEGLPYVFPPALRCDLMGHLGAGGIRGAAALAFLDSSCIFAEMVGDGVGHPTPGEQRAQVRRLGAAAGAFVEAIEGVSEASLRHLQLYAKHAARPGNALAIDIAPKVIAFLDSRERNESVLAPVLDLLQALQAVCAAAEAGYVVDASHSHEDARGEFLVELLVNAFERQFQRMPPRGDSWFADFTSRLAKHLRAAGGTRIVNRVLQNTAQRKHSA